MTTTNMNNNVQEGPGMEEFVDVNSLAKKFGPPASWWYQKAESGEVPSYKLGKYRRFRMAEIESWLQSRRSGSEPR